MPRLRPLLPSVVRPARSYFVILTASAILLFSAACKPFGDFGAGKKDDTVAGASVNPNQVVTPVFSPAGGTYAPTPNVSMTSTTPTATVCYTTDGVTTPTCNATTGTCITGTTYAGALSVGASQTIMALACKAGMINSTVTTGVYTIDGTAPVLTLTTPATGVPRTNTQVTYDINDASGGCASASITWTWVSGNPDPGGAPAGTHTQALTGGELVNGTHSNVTLTNNPSLVDGATYNVALRAPMPSAMSATPQHKRTSFMILPYRSFQPLLRQTAQRSTRRRFLIHFPKFAIPAASTGHGRAALPAPTNLMR